MQSLDKIIHVNRVIGLSTDELGVGYPGPPAPRFLGVIICVASDHQPSTLAADTQGLKGQWVHWQTN